MSSHENFKNMREMNYEVTGFLQWKVRKCTICKVTLSKATLPENDRQSPVCKNCNSTAAGGVFYLTREGEKLGPNHEDENN